MLRRMHLSRLSGLCKIHVPRCETRELSVKRGKIVEVPTFLFPPKNQTWLQARRWSSKDGGAIHSTIIEEQCGGDDRVESD